MNAKTVPFGSIAEFRNGINYVAADIGDVVKVVGVGDFGDRSRLDKFSELSTVMVNGSLAADDELRDGDLLLVRSNGSRDLVGRSLIIKGPPPGVTFSGFTIRARVEPSVALPEFVALVLQGSAIKNHLLLAGGGNGNIANVSQSLLRDIELPLPPVNAQRAIVGVVSSWDSAIEKAKRVIAARQALHDVLASRLYAFGGHRGRPAKFGVFLRESTVTGSSGRDARKITVKLYGKGVVAKEERRQGSEQTQYFVRRGGQLIYSKLDFLNGAFGIVPPELDGFESTLDLPAFDIDASVNPIWLLGYLTRPSYYTRQLGLSRGQRKARRVHPSDLLASAISLPPRTVQDQIAQTLEASRQSIEICARLLAALQRQKRGLMQKLLTGQWRLPALDSTPEEHAPC